MVGEWMHEIGSNGMDAHVAAYIELRRRLLDGEATGAVFTAADASHLPPG